MKFFTSLALAHLAVTPGLALTPLTDFVNPFIGTISSGNAFPGQCDSPNVFNVLISRPRLRGTPCNGKGIVLGVAVVRAGTYCAYRLALMLMQASAKLAICQITLASLAFR